MRRPCLDVMVSVDIMAKDYPKMHVSLWFKNRIYKNISSALVNIHHFFFVVVVENPTFVRHHTLRGSRFIRWGRHSDNT